MNENNETADFLAVVGPNLTQNARVHLNLGQVFIVITEDKLAAILKEHADCLALRDKWHTPASTLLLVFGTSSFHDALNFSKETWEAVSLISTALTFGWLLKAAFSAWRAHKTVESLIEEIKRTGVVRQSG
jgi:hypothetical protein